MMEPIVLSARDTDRFQEIAVDKAAAKVAFDAANAFHLNQIATLITSEKLLWEHITETYNLDPDIKHRAAWSQLDRRMIIEERDDGDDE